MGGEQDNLKQARSRTHMANNHQEVPCLFCAGAHLTGGYPVTPFTPLILHYPSDFNAVVSGLILVIEDVDLSRRLDDDDACEALGVKHYLNKLLEFRDLAKYIDDIEFTYVR